MGGRYDRWLKLEEKRNGQPIELSEEQIRFLEKLNPAFRERHVESQAPGELLSQDTFFVGTLKGIGRLYLHAVVDTYSSYAVAVVARISLRSLLPGWLRNDQDQARAHLLTRVVS